MAWEKLTTEGVQFTYDALPALGGGISLGGAPHSPVTEALVPRSVGDAALDSLARSDAVLQVITWSRTLQQSSRTPVLRSLPPQLLSSCRLSANLRTLTLSGVAPGLPRGYQWRGPDGGSSCAGRRRLRRVHAPRGRRGAERSGGWRSCHAQRWRREE